MRGPRSLAEAVERRAEQEPDRPLVSWLDGEELTAAQLHRRAAEVAGGLIGRVKPGAVVASAPSRGLDSVVLTTALSLLGAVELPIPAQMARGSVQHLLRRAGAELAILGDTRMQAEPSLADAVGGRIVVVSPHMPELRSTPPRVTHRPSESDLACVIATSGTTGLPKGVALPNGAALGQAERVRSAMGYGGDDVLFNFFPWCHINARHAAFLPAVISGARIVLTDGFSAERFWGVVDRESITAFNFMGAVCAILLKHPAAESDRHHRVTRAYGGPAPRWMYEAMLHRFGVELLQAYACTELGDVATTRVGEARPGAAGRVVAEYDVRIESENGEECQPGAAGSLLVRPSRPDLTFVEYVGDPKATQFAWRGGWFRTGDRARVIDGWLYYEGRGSDMIRRRGHNISPLEVEQSILAMAEISEVVVIGVPSELTEDEILAIVVPSPGSDIDPAAVRSHCRGRVPDYALPRFISVVHELPMTESLKVRRDVLRRRGLRADVWDADRTSTALTKGSE